MARARQRDVLPVPGGPWTRPNLEVPTWEQHKFLEFSTFFHLQRVDLAASKLKADLNVLQQVLLQAHLEDEGLPEVGCHPIILIEKKDDQPQAEELSVGKNHHVEARALILLLLPLLIVVLHVVVDAHPQVLVE